MATQHPDNAGAPWWKGDPFVSTHEELEELLLLFRDFPVDEYMWDWEGKHVDEAVGEKLYARASDFFAKHPLGEDKHLTFRIPAYEEGKMHRTARAFMNVLSLWDMAAEMRLPRPPVTEMFVPLTTKAQHLIAVRKAFLDVAEYHRKVFGTSERAGNREHQIHVTPLVEDVESLFGMRSIVEPYWRTLDLGSSEAKERGLRVFLARSDPAMNAGLIPAVVAAKAALSVLADLSDELSIPVHPVIGTGSLPFRGSVNPTYVDTFLPQYAGVRTYSIQSAFRYDYSQDEVRHALERMRAETPRLEALRLSEDERAKLLAFSQTMIGEWKKTIEPLAPLINLIAKHIPPRRERLQHIGLFGYSRGVGKVTLPRAIGFTAAFYSIGVPPELLTTGRALRLAKKEGLLPLLEKTYPALRNDLIHAGKYFNRENLELLAKTETALRPVIEDVAVIEEWLGSSLGPVKPHHVIHRNITSTIAQRIVGDVEPGAIRHDIVEAAKIRRSLG